MKEKKFLDEVTTRVAYPASGGGYPLQRVRIVSPFLRHPNIILGTAISCLLVYFDVDTLTAMGAVDGQSVFLGLLEQFRYRTSDGIRNLI